MFIRTKDHFKSIEVLQPGLFPLDKQVAPGAEGDVNFSSHHLTHVTEKSDSQL
jgi:hypothetical protein